MGDLPAELSPWGNPAWRAGVREWVRERLRDWGASEIGELTPRIRPWSVTGQISTDRGPVWFKAVPPGSAFEPALTAALSRLVPGQVLVPLAIDPERGWSLLPDGGLILGEARDAAAGRTDGAEPEEAPGGSAEADRPADQTGSTGADAVSGGSVGAAGAPAGPRGWGEPLRQYAALQRAVSPHVEELAGLGVPDLRPAQLPGQFDALLGSAQLKAQVDAVDGITARQYADLEALRPRLAQWCARLAASPVPLSLDHSDLHDYQVFAAGDRYVFFDWGDASIAHPFTSLLVALRSAAARYELADDAPELGRLREAYLEAWAAEQPAAELRADARLAMRLGGIGRALCWQRAFPEAAEHLWQDQGRSVAHWLAHLLDPVP